MAFLLLFGHDYLGMIFLENRYPLFRIMLKRFGHPRGGPAEFLFAWRKAEFRHFDRGRHRVNDTGNDYSQAIV